MGVGVFSVWFFGRYDIAGLDFLFIAALMSGFVMAVYVPMILYMNLTYLPESARPGWINIVSMVLASAMYIGFAGYTVYSVSGQSRPLYPPPLICGPLFFFIGQINRRTHEFNRKSNADSSFSRAMAGDSAAF